MSAVCPGCGASVHPLLAPAPLVLGDRVVMCCSDGCRQQVAADPSTALSAPTASDRHTGTEEVGAVTRDGDLAEAETPEAAEAPVHTTSAVEPPATAEASQRRVVLATLLGGGTLAVLFVGYLIISHALGGAGTGQSSLSLALGPVEPAPPTRRTAPAPRPKARPAPARAVAKRPSLMTLKKQSWRVLEGFLVSRTGRFWRTAARVLAEQGHSGGLAALRKGLSSKRWAGRQRAAEALAKLGHAEGVEVLKKDLAARRRPVQWAAAFALARCGNKSGLRIIRQLTAFRQHRMTAYEALVRLGEARGAAELRRVLAESRAPYDRLRAAVALGLRGDRSGLTVLRRRMKQPGMHMGVALALQKLGAPEARAALLRALEHTALREEAARALRSYGDVTPVSRMAPELGSDSEEARLTAAAAIVILTAQATAEAR